MINKIQKIFLYFLCFIRKPISRFLWVLFKVFISKGKNIENNWEQIKKLKLKKFNSLLSDVEYKSDPLHGVLDYTLYDINYYFSKELEKNHFYGRDCDDTSYVWFEYLKENEHVDKVYIILCIDGFNIKSLHFFVVALLKDNYYYIFNYSVLPKIFLTLEEACEYFKKRELTVHGKYNNLAWVIYRKFIR